MGPPGGDRTSGRADWAWDHSLVGAAWNHREEIGAALDRGLDMAQDFGGEVGERLDQGVDMVEDGLSSVGERAGDVWEAATPW